MTSIIPSFAAPLPVVPPGIGGALAAPGALAVPGAPATDASPADTAALAALQSAFAGVFARVLAPRADGLPPAAAGSEVETEGSAPLADGEQPAANAAPESGASTTTAGAHSVFRRHDPTDALRDLVARVTGTHTPPAPNAANLSAVTPPQHADAVPSGAGTVGDAGADQTAETSKDGDKGTSPDAASAPVDGADAANASRVLETARALAATDPAVVVRDLAALQPAFREKVERVIARMHDEFGSAVTVAESWRSQTRQDFLVEQGRTRPGPVVTWTRQSLHSDGAAVDLVVDGKWDNGQGYQRLARIANEEGLQTLGTRDPGHVQLPASDRALHDIAKVATVSEIRVASNTPRAAMTSSSLASPSLTSPASRSDSLLAVPARDTVTPRPRSSGDIASVAAVARVADVAPVARVASVMASGVAAPIRARRTESEASGTAHPAESSPARSGTNAGNDAPAPRSDRTVSRAGDSMATRPDDAARPTEERSSVRRATTVGGAAHAAEAFPTAPRAGDVRAPLNTVRPLMDATPVDGVIRSDAASRVDQVLSLQDAHDAQPASQMTLKIDNADGGQDHIRVAVRGASVGATIEVRDAASAEQLNSRIHELSAALEARGLSGDSVHVRAAAVAGLGNTIDSTRGFTAADPAALRPGTLFAESGSSARSRGDAQQQRNSQDPSRNRSRREQRDGSQ